MFLIYGGDEELIVNGYTDASFQTDTNDSQFQLGFVFTINGGAVSWKSSKQATMTNSTTEAEYITTFKSAKEGVWMRMFLIELGVFVNALSPLNLHYDNNGVIAQAKEPRITRRTNMCYGSFTSFESSLGKVKSRCAKDIQI